MNLKFLNYDYDYYEKKSWCHCSIDNNIHEGMIINYYACSQRLVNSGKYAMFTLSLLCQECLNNIWTSEEILVVAKFASY